ncbi:MAG TPA: hypothetical protein VL625_11460 [Patescibacteria group bacterium]|nr:hypothetical protein [Patescibacteria group bacterium]
MAGKLPRTNRAFNSSSQPVAPDGEMAFVVDVPSFGMMSHDDAQAYANKLGSAIDDLRARGIPITWFSMSDKNELILPEKVQAGQTPKVRALDAIVGREFYGANDGQRNADIYAKFWEEHGARTDEAICCKYFKNAFTIPQDADGKPAYRDILAGETGMPFDKNESRFQHRPTFAQYMEQQGVRKPILIGAVASHCIPETAAGAVINGMTPTICPDLVLSWEGDQEAEIDQDKSRLRFQDGAAAASPVDYHTGCIRGKLDIIAGEQKSARGISDDDAEAIRNIRIEKYVDLARKLPLKPDNEESSSRPTAGSERFALQL